jgi:glucose-6-phosphate isomerase
MISFDLKNLKQDFSSQSKEIANSLQKIRSRKQGFYEIVDDKKTAKEILKFAKTARKKYKHFVLLGIGGSSLGPLCIEQSFGHLFKEKKLLVLDNIDPVLLAETEEVIDYKTTLFLVVTKSGTTPETMSQYFYFRDKVNKKKLDPKKHFVFITDPEKGLLREIANKEKIPSFEIPENVGGRFSVLTAVGLLPAALLGININKMLAGARKMRDQFLSTNSKENLPFQLAKIQYELSQKGKSINVMIPYSQKLFRLADWYRQLLAESIGKKFDNEQKIVNVGITPVNALGVTDQHSQLQLYNEGPNDKLFIFIEVEKLKPVLKIPSQLFNKNITFNQLLQIEKNATASALTKNSRPNFTIKIDEINEENIGALFMLFEGATAFLGEMFNINTFDQPGVELSKKLTKEALLKI